MRAFICVAFAAALAAWSPAMAKQAMTPAQLASAIEGRAESSSFADLRRFGDAAMLGNDRDALRRLHYVATVFRNQSEYELFSRYNEAMADKARLLGDDRYLTIADLNRIVGRMSQGDPSAVADLEARQTASDDWYVRAHARTLWAMVLITRQ